MASSVSSSSSISGPSFHPVASLSIGSSSSAGAPQESDANLQFAMAKVKEVVGRAERVAEEGEPLEQERVKVLASGLLQHIRESSKVSLDENAQRDEISDWAAESKLMDVNGLKVMTFLSEKGCLGTGGECYVYVGIMETGLPCAVKIMDDLKEEEEIARRTAVLDKICQSPYVVHHYGSTQELMLEELCSRSLYSLYEDAFEKNDPESLETLNRLAYPFIKQTLTAVADMHAVDVVHGDIKLENILLSTSGEEIRISDLSGAVEMGQRIRASTLRFSSPEQNVFFKELVEKGVSSPLDSKKSEAWQTMLTIAQIGKGKLSQDFRKKIEGYIEEQDRIQLSAIKYADTQFNREGLPARHTVAMAARYADKAQLSLDCNGVFSTLTPTNSLEKLLVLMSHFDPEQRISAQQALEFFTEYCGEEKN